MMDNAFTEQDMAFMREAIACAELATERGEVPVGAVVVADGKIIGRGSNQPISTSDPTAHAEVVAIRQAAKKLANYRLNGSTLYTTIEPCSMCAGSLIHARIERLVFGAHDEKAGAAASVFHLLDSNERQHRVVWQGGLLEEECAALVSEFFKKRRAEKGNDREAGTNQRRPPKSAKDS